MSLGAPLVWENPDVITVNDNLYCKTTEALGEVVDRLGAFGYAVSDRYADPDALEQHSAEYMHEHRFARYYASLDVERIKCDNCKKYIKRRGVASHGHRCEFCGAITYREMVRGDDVTFSFIAEGNDHVFWPPKLRMTIRRYDGTHLWLEPTPVENDNDFDGLSVEKALAELEKHSDKWIYDTIKGKKYIKIVEPPSFSRSAVRVIEIKQNWPKRYYSEVSVWQGREFGRYDRNFPVPMSLHIYDASQWERLTPSPTLHEQLLRTIHQTSDCGYWYQDGRKEHKTATFEALTPFVEHFTTLDIDAWKRFVPLIPLDGPGAIIAIARFCHPRPTIRNERNIANVMNFALDVVAGKPVSYREAYAAAHGLTDPAIAAVVEDIIVGYSMHDVHEL